MTLPTTLRRALVAAGLAGGLIGGVVGIGHAVAATNSPSTKSPTPAARHISGHTCHHSGGTHSSGTTSTAIGL